MQAQVIVNPTNRPIFGKGVSEIRTEGGAPATLDIFDLPHRRRELPKGDWRRPAEGAEVTVLRCRMN